MKERPHSALYDEPGTGKTVQELMAAVEPVLVVAPAMVLDSGTWDDEIEKWAPGLDVTQVAYTSLNEREKTARGGTRPTEFPRPEYRRRWGTIIADESHHMKGRKTSWTLALKKLAKDAGRFRQATGTPIPNWAHEAFVSLQFAYPEEAAAGHRFGSYWRWVAEWFHVGPKVDWQGNILAQKAVHDFREDRSWDDFYRDNWGDRMLMRLREDCLDLPPLTVQPWRVRMKGPQAKAYRELKKDFVTWLESGKEVAACNSAAQTIKLLQAATGLDVLDPDVRGSAKLDALKDILRDRPRPTLVVAHFRRSVQACARAAEEVGADVRVITGDTSRAHRREISRSFKSGSLQVLCATIDTINEGMTYTAADQAIRVERSWLPSRNDSVARRLHRMGQERSVLVIDLIAEGTHELRQLKVLAEKSDQAIRALGRDDLLALVS